MVSSTSVKQSSLLAGAGGERASPDEYIHAYIHVLLKIQILRICIQDLPICVSRSISTRVPVKVHLHV